jgi:predicted transcriptional regulator
MAALSVRDIMDEAVPSVYETDSIDRVLRVMREHELPGIPVVNEGGRCVGIITENDLVMTGEDADLHLPHYFELFGGCRISRIGCARRPRRPRRT